MMPGLTSTQWLSCSRRAFSKRRSKGGIIDEQLGGRGQLLKAERGQQRESDRGADTVAQLAAE